ncbi:MAG: single-stranded-DNA-specific exonuclease RecJ [Candidatus Nomurabacteria bacterium]|jgi:single-stranded-DNA-specific exonuclease|nr:single-stranded-DNA-specific exonuclease RecJ [Candidatus Nomurabacteria bacterium]
MNAIVEKVLARRGYETSAKVEEFLHPNYDDGLHDPFLLPDMTAAVERISRAIAQGERILIYGDYDVDGMTATVLLGEALAMFGAEQVETYTPDRFAEGYGLNMDAIEKISEMNVDLIISVDCGSLSVAEVELAGSFGMDVIITDHHSVGEVLPPAVAVVNPKRHDSKYPFGDLAGVGVVFKLVRAILTRGEVTSRVKAGQEKWWLDLVALGTICDIVPLTDENRVLVYWGLEVLRKVRRAGLRALLSVAQVSPEKLDARAIGFAIGPRLNAAGRLETAEIALRLLRADGAEEAFGLAQELDELNYARRRTQERIFEEAVEKINSDRSSGTTLRGHLISNELTSTDLSVEVDLIVKSNVNRNAPESSAGAPSVIVVSGAGWSHGVVGIVASKLMEKYQRPVFVFEELPDGTSKGSARSFGDFSIAAAIDAARDLIQRGGGHAAAGGVTMATKNLAKFRVAVNRFYNSLALENQAEVLEPTADVEIDDFKNVTAELVKELALLEPFGMGNEQPILAAKKLQIIGKKTLGAENQHVKFRFKDAGGKVIEMIKFGAADELKNFIASDKLYKVLFTPSLNEWNGRTSVEGRLISCDTIES